MRFERYPLDYQTCQFKVGSYAYDENKMTFAANLLQYDDSLRNTILDYGVSLLPLAEEDSLYVFQDIGNYSLTGFEMRLKRNTLKYLVNYYLPSGLFVFVSWVSFALRGFTNDERKQNFLLLNFSGELLNTTGDCSWSNDIAGYSIPRVDQHLQ